MTTRPWRLSWHGEAMYADQMTLGGWDHKPRTASYATRFAAEEAAEFLVRYGRTNGVPPVITDTRAEAQR